MKRLTVLLAILIMLLFTLPALAQDTTVTDEPAAETEQVIATVTASDFVTPTETATETPVVVTATEAAPTPIVIVVTQPPVVPPANPDPPVTDDLPEGNVSIPGWSIVVVIVLGIAGGASIPGLIERVRRDPRAIAEIETRVEALPEPVVSGMHQVGVFLESAAKLLTEASDKMAAANKPPEKPNLSLVTTAELNAELARRTTAG